MNHADDATTNSNAFDRTTATPNPGRRSATVDPCVIISHPASPDPFAGDPSDPSAALDAIRPGIPLDDW